MQCPPDYVNKQAAEKQQALELRLASAEQLLEKALETADRLFNSGDLTPYLNVLCRLHNYNFYNILLILRQYPEATTLTTSAQWKTCMNGSGQEVIKEEHHGKGIRLVAPFVSLNPPFANFISLVFYDVSQTNVTGYQRVSIYRVGDENTTLLYGALRMALSSEYRTSVIYMRELFKYAEYHIPGYREGNSIYCRPDIPKEELIRWLVRNMLELSEPDKVIGKRYLALFLDMAQYCLLNIWGITDRRTWFFYQDPDLIRSIPQDLRKVFLDLLQRRVRKIEEVVNSAYQELLQDREEEPMPYPPTMDLLASGKDDGSI